MSNTETVVRIPFYGIEWIEYEMDWNGKIYVIYNGKAFKDSDVEIPLMHEYSKECKEIGKVSSLSGFEKWMRENAECVRDFMDKMVEDRLYTFDRV